MNDLVHIPKAIEPTEVWSPSTGGRAIPAGPGYYSSGENYYARVRNVTPVRCIHHRREFYSGVWKCQDCGAYCEPSKTHL